MANTATIVQLKALQVWTYLGAEMQAALEQKFSTMDEAGMTQVSTALMGLQKTFEEVKTEANEETFIFLMQKALLNLADDLLREVDDVKKEYFKEKEQAERTAEVRVAEATLGSI